MERPRSRWIVWGRRAAWAMVPAVAVYYALFGGEYSTFDVRALDRSREAATRRVDSLRAQVDSLTAWADSLERDAFAIERVARERYGFVRDGERVYRFVPKEADGSGDPVRETGVDRSRERR